MVWDWECSQGRVNGESCMALLDNGMQINTIMLGFVETYSLDVGPLLDLVGGWITCIGLVNLFTQCMGYVVIWVQVDRVHGYDEDQIALVIQDLSNSMAWVPVIMGTLMIGHLVKMIKEREIDALTTKWVSACMAYLLAVRWATATVEDKKVAAGVLDLTEYDEVVTTKDTKMIDAFLSCIIHARVRTTYTGVGLNLMTQALHAEHGLLPRGLTIQNTYTEMLDGSKNVTVVVKNSMAYCLNVRKKIPVARAVVATWVPEPPMWTSVV